MSLINSFQKKTYDPFIFSRKGVTEAGEILASSLISHYNALRRDMFRWEDSSNKCEEMFLKSRKRAPEEHIVEYGQVTFFELNGNVHALPICEEYREVNVYGYLDNWYAISPSPRINMMLYNNPLNNENAVICEDSLTFTHDNRFIENIVYGMVDILLSMRQRSILNRQPFIFTTNEMDEPKQGEIGSFMNALLACKPYIIQGKDTFDFKVFPTQTNVDIGITDYFSFLEALILSHIGYDATDVHKRAQQSVPETLLAQDKILARRHEKLRLREEAAEKCNDLFGTKLEVISVLDTYDQPTQGISAMDSVPELSNFMDDADE